MLSDMMYVPVDLTVKDKLTHAVSEKKEKAMMA